MLLVGGYPWTISMSPTQTPHLAHSPAYASVRGGWNEGVWQPCTECKYADSSHGGTSTGLLPYGPGNNANIHTMHIIMIMFNSPNLCVFFIPCHMLCVGMTYISQFLSAINYGWSHPCNKRTVKHPIVHMLTSLVAGCFLDTTGGVVSIGTSMENIDVSSLGPLS